MTVRVSKGYCTSCDRDVFRSPGDDSSCPVCSSPLIRSEITHGASSGPTRSHDDGSGIPAATGAE